MAVTNVSTEYNVSEILKIVAESCKITDWQFSVHNFESAGQNYFGVLVPLNFIGTAVNKEPVSIRLVLKLAPADKRFRLSDAVTRMFDREIFVYSTILRKYKEIQKSLSTAHYIIPRCYYTCKNYCEEVIVMQDMRGEGYVPHSGAFLDLDHILVSVKALAKFHALSFILKHTDSNLYDEIEQKCVPLNETTDKRFHDVLRDRLLKALEKFANTEYVTLLKNLEKNCTSFIKQTTEVAAETCICHGDIWKENILFKYEDTKPIEACLLDYQTTRMCSPAYDILYLITSSTDSDLRHNHIDQLLDTYYRTFETYLSAAGLDADSVYSKEKFNNDLKVVGPAVFIVANTALWLSNGLQQEGHVRSKRILSTDDEKLHAVQKYMSLIKGIIDDFISYGYLCVC